MVGDLGFCGFCGLGGGHLGEMGDESSQYLHSSVRSGEPGNWTYAHHPNAWDKDPQFITWCGRCVGGLIHKYQRYDDTNLRALFLSTQLRLELDGLRWVAWEADDLEREYMKKFVDDPAIHLEKLSLERDLHDLTAEQTRRHGADLTERGWRP